MKYFRAVTLAACIALLSVELISPHVVIAEEFPDISLAAPESEGDRKYLGITSAAGENFSISDISADIVFIELFSMYCPYCQAEAPLINELHDKALQLESKGITIRFVGIGASNTQFEVDYFKDTYEINFPVFPDKSLDIYKTLKGEGTPGFLGVVLKDGENPRIVLRQSGGFESADDFLNRLLAKAGY